MLAALNDVVECSLSNRVVKAIRLAYQEVNMTLERNLVIHVVTYDITTHTHTHTHTYIYI